VSTTCPLITLPPLWSEPPTTAQEEEFRQTASRRSPRFYFHKPRSPKRVCNLRGGYFEGGRKIREKLPPSPKCTNETRRGIPDPRPPILGAFIKLSGATNCWRADPKIIREKLPPLCRKHEDIRRLLPTFSVGDHDCDFLSLPLIAPCYFSRRRPAWSRRSRRTGMRLGNPGKVAPLSRRCEDEPQPAVPCAGSPVKLLGAPTPLCGGQKIREKLPLSQRFGHIRRHTPTLGVGPFVEDCKSNVTCHCNGQLRAEQTETVAFGRIANLT
jgi:hypothetical protein